MYLVGGTLDAETVLNPEFQNAMWLSLLLYLPLSLVFWHAPALVYWHGVPAVKSLFFSAVACLQNWRAFLAVRRVVGIYFLGHHLDDHSWCRGLMGDGDFAGLACCQPC